jgi:hypothetical protein
MGIDGIALSIEQLKRKIAMEENRMGELEYQFRAALMTSALGLDHL